MNCSFESLMETAAVERCGAERTGSSHFGAKSLSQMCSNQKRSAAIQYRLLEVHREAESAHSRRKAQSLRRV
jgi:hypothetical protein